MIALFIPAMLAAAAPQAFHAGPVFPTYGQIASVEVQYHDAIRQHQRTIGDGQGSLGQMAGHQQRRASAALFAHQLPQGDR